MPKLLKVVLFLVVLAVLVSVVQLFRAVPAPQFSAETHGSVVPGTPVSLPWPSGGSGQVELENAGIIGGANPNSELPLGSVAKMITALVVVKDHPLSLGATGPIVTVNASDVNLYQTMVHQQDTVIPVALGEQLNEYQLLEGLLVPSANNFAVMLANWDAGSSTAFAAKMNSLVKSLGIHRIVLSGPSGLNPHSVGSAHDLVVVAQAVLKNPVLRYIVAKAQATLPVAGITYNINYDVGHNGFVGIETGIMGNGGDFVFAANGPSSSSGLIIGAVLGQPGAQPLIAALNEGNKLVDAARKVPATVSVLNSGQGLAKITAPGENPVVVKAAQGVSMLGWPGLRVSYSYKFSKLPHSLKSGAKVGTVTVTSGTQSKTVPLVTSSAVRGPSITWRLMRP
jgi:D-alanyl-D-alanine carboxypeptidase (penicillin-binding protein 5/6)